MKKIKSVKLRTNGTVKTNHLKVPELKYKDGYWYLKDLKWSNEDMVSGSLDGLFKIEYEDLKT